MLYWTYKHKGVDVMAMSKEDKQEFFDLLAPIVEQLKALRHMQTETGTEIKTLKQGQARLEKRIDEEHKDFKRGQARLEKKMDEGFKFLETCINEAAVDIGKTNKRLRDHIDLPVH
jgi:hypothetical protein